MKKKLSFTVFCFVLANYLHAQIPVKYNILYKTIYAKDLCRLSKQNLILIDVRSAGEYSDTSQYASLNMGYLKNAINIPIDSIQKNVHILDNYKDKTLVLYCSHSQRSRRVSKLLSENGFSNFYNLNGGMSQLNQMTEKDFPCLKDWMLSNTKYTNLSTDEAISMINKDPDLQIIDIRSEAMFNSKDSLLQNNIGRIRGSINLPYANAKQNIQSIESFKQKPVLVYGQSGDGDAARMAQLLVDAGFKNVYHLLAGINEVLQNEKGVALIENAPQFKLVDARATLSLLQSADKILIYDTRPTGEFQNQATGREMYKNLGHIKNAINIPKTDFLSYSYPPDKNTRILIYGNGDGYELAHQLKKSGYRNIYLFPGMYGLVSSAFNIEESKAMLNYLVNHDGLY